MKDGKQLSGIFAACGMLLLILDGKTALEGAKAGIDLCLKTVIPSLFPFFLLSILLTGNHLGSPGPVLRLFGRIFKMPKGSETLLLPALLGGYPVGAQCISEAYRNGQLSKNNAQRLLGFCSNAGPAFLFGLVSPMFSRSWMVWVLWCIHIAGAAFVANILSTRDDTHYRQKNMPETDITVALQKSIYVMATVCGWIILFRVMIHFLERWIFWMIPVAAQVFITGTLELANGCCALSNISSEPLRFILCSAILSFGGLCVTMQTSSVIRGLSLRGYLSGKILQTIFSTAASMTIVSRSLLPMCIILPFFLLGWRKKQKSSSIRTAVVV